jgi:hypothetical protein
MQFSNKFKIIWWIAILILVGIILYNRIEAIFSGNYIPGDVFLLLLFIALLLVPIFTEIDFFGVVKLKKEVEDLKNEIHINFGEIRNEIKSTISPTFTNQIHLDRPANDEVLQELDKQIKNETPKEEYQSLNLDEINIPEENIELFKARYSIEQELKRIHTELLMQLNSSISIKDNNTPATQMLNLIADADVLSKNIIPIIREIILITNQAIHGAELTESQIDFVNNNTGVILRELKRVHFYNNRAEWGRL